MIDWGKINYTCCCACRVKVGNYGINVWRGCIGSVNCYNNIEIEVICGYGRVASKQVKRVSKNSNLFKNNFCSRSNWLCGLYQRLIIIHFSSTVFLIGSRNARNRRWARIFDYEISDRVWRSKVGESSNICFERQVSWQVNRVRILSSTICWCNDACQSYVLVFVKRVWFENVLARCCRTN